MRNIKLTIAYDGTDYHGWQHQPGMATIQGQVSQAAERLFGRAVQINGASRTDAGVHALGQVANFRIDTPVPTENMPRALSEILPDDIAVTDAAEVGENFDAISSAKRKIYRYTIFTGKSKPVLCHRTCLHRPFELDTGQIAAAAKDLIGEHDFKSFASAGDQRADSIREIYRLDVDRRKEFIYIEVEGNGFLYNMVRNIVGTLIEIGRGHWGPERIAEILAARDRSKAGPTAAAKGLCLVKIFYE